MMKVLADLSQLNSLQEKTEISYFLILLSGIYFAKLLIK